MVRGLASWQGRALALVFGAVLVLLGAERAEADVILQVTEIRASQGAAHVDPRLEALRDRLRDYRYTRYVLVQQTPKTRPLDREVRFPLAGGLKLTVTARRSGSGFELDCVVMRDDQRVASIRAVVQSGGAPLLFALPPEGNERTFLAVSARRD